MEFLIYLAPLAIPLLWWVTVYNKITKIGVKINEAESGIDVALSRRYSILTKMFKVVGKYMEHEKEIFESITLMRTKMINGSSLNEKEAFHSKLNSAYSRMSIVVEAYPELKADSLMLELQESIVDSEDHLQAARRAFNANVSYFNQSISIFPNSIVANSMNASSQKFYEVDESEKGTNYGTL